MGMFGRNGNGPRNVVPMGGAVPIVGLPCTMRAVSLTAILTCNCEAKTLVFLQGPVGVNAKCKACKRIYVIGGIVWQQGQQPEVSLQIVADTDDAIDDRTPADQSVT